MTLYPQPLRCEQHMAIRGVPWHLRLCPHPARFEARFFDGKVQRLCGTHARATRARFPKVPVAPIEETR